MAAILIQTFYLIHLRLPVKIPFEFGRAGRDLVAQYFGAPVSISVDIGSGLLIWNSGPLNDNDDGPTVSVANNDSFFGGDEFSLVGGKVSPADMVLPAGTTISDPFALAGILSLNDQTGTALDDLSIPTSFNLSAFKSIAQFTLIGGSATPFGKTGVFDFRAFCEIDVHLDSLTVRNEGGNNAVPEPSTFVISSILFGIVGVVAARQRLPRSNVRAEREPNPSFFICRSR